MLTLLLSPADGGTAWRQLLAEGEARAGWEPVGPLGLARRAARLLGLAFEPAPAPDRIAAYSARLAVHEDGRRSYSASRAADPYGVAAHLLSLRDRLRLAGWRGDPLSGSPRLLDLSGLEALDTPPLPPGAPDLLGDLVAAAGAAPLPCPLAIELTAEREAYAPLVRDLLAALARAGATVREAATAAPLAPAGTDLGRVQRALLDPRAPPAALAGDGSFLLLEADTPIESAELAAALLRTWPLASTTAVVTAGAEPLDAALSRQGLPTLGLSTASTQRPHAQVLPLRLALAFRPRDPLRAAELLLLPGGPLPGKVRRALLSALAEQPGLGSPAWREAVEALAAEAGEEGAALRRSVEQWFGGEAHDPAAGIPAPEAAALASQVGSWAGSRAAGAEEEGHLLDAALWSQASITAHTLARNLTALPQGERLSPLGLGQLHDLAAGSGAEASPFAAEAGRPAVCTGPGAVQPGASSVLWFGFVDGEGAAAPEPFTEAERRTLLEAGLSLAAPGEARGVEAGGWRRPLLLARERVALVRWRLDGADPVAPHALQDELRVRTAPGALAACIRSSERLLAGAAPALATVPVPPAAPIGPRAVWTVPPAALGVRGQLSATTIQALLGCPFRWALEHQARLQPGRALDLPDGSRLLGTFAHALLQDMLLGPQRLDLATCTPDQASAWALAAFDARVGTEAAPLAALGREAERDGARALVGRAAGALVALLQKGGWRPSAAELEVKGRFAGLPVHGYVDLVLEKRGQPALLDLKLAHGGHRRAELEEGHGLQIALYASLLRRGGDVPPAGFFILADGELLTVSPRAFPGATVVDGPSSDETLRDAEERFRAWQGVLRKGALPVCADDLPWQGPVAEAGGPELDGPGEALRQAACRFCRVETLCRTRVGEGAPP
ncbi:MAG: PD-(D/E)XK nuclease family protein [Deltaproteobacteria bacterium]|nr:PD-(D/E)XK nuclease family protein [Deltaproteobacteria bacterium]